LLGTAKMKKKPTMTGNLRKEIKARNEDKTEKIEQ
jgi:hypothetical protein